MLLYVASDIGGVNGATQAARDILISLLSTGYPVTVISNGKCSLPQQVNGQVLPSPNWIVLVKETSFPSQINRHLLMNLASWSKKKLLKILQKKQLQQLDLNLIIVNNLSSHSLWTKINPGISGKTVLIVHTSPRHYEKPMSTNLDLALALMKEYSAFIFVSSSCQKEWLKFDDLKDKPSFYIPNCCREDMIANLISQDRLKVRQKLGIDLDKFIVVCVASLQPRKRQDLLVELFPDLVAPVPNLEIYLVGPIAFDYQWAKYLLDKVESNGFNEQIKYVGSRTDAMDFIYAADLLVLPSRAEAMPLVILEAMALKTSVIASDVDGIPELIEHKINGLLFSDKKPQSFIDAFTYMATNPSIKQLFAERAYLKYWSCFSRKQQISKYNEAINQIISND